MPTIITRGAGSAQGLGYASSSAAVTYIEDVFSTYLYTGNGSTQTITNGIDLSGKGGLVWGKERGSANSHRLQDTVRGAGNVIYTNGTNAQGTDANSITFGSTGFSIGSNANYNFTSSTYASWTFREQPKFFDIVTYTGDGTSARAINHNLGSAPGMIVVKCTNDASNWPVYHRSLGATQFVLLNNTDNAFSSSSYWANTEPTSTQFSVGFTNNQNSSGQTYVAYLFAHDAGGFGLTGTDNVISCGSYVTTGGGTNTINLGWEPQWVLVKRATDILGDPDRDAWHITDSMRGMTAFDGAGSTPAAELRANASDAEVNLSDFVLNATGFTVGPGNWNGSTAATYIYIAIRRGPMKVPTSGTSVFSPVLQSPQSAGTVRTVGFPADLVIGNIRSGSGHYFQDRLRGFPSSGTTQNTLSVQSQSTAAEASAYPYFYDVWNTTAKDGDLAFMTNGVGWTFGRAPGFFDEVCYTGTGGTNLQTHNLGVTPELLIIRSRSQSGTYGGYWLVLSASGSNYRSLFLNTTDGNQGNFAISSISTATTINIDYIASNILSVNTSAATYVAYLFATVAGVSKVGSYTGTGTTQVINCGFTAGARFVLIKRTDSTGDWYVWDSARGIVAGNDPYLLLNSTAAEVTGTDYVDTAASGFEISSTAPAAINANGGTFIFLAIA